MMMDDTSPIPSGSQNIQKHLTKKEKVTYMLEGMLEYSNNHLQKKAELPCLIAIVTNSENLNQFAIVFISKKNKKIELILPLTTELQVLEADSLNMICYWDSDGWQQQSLQNSPTRTQEGQASSPFKVRVLCNHAGEKKGFIDRFTSIKQYLPREPNTFANMKTHQWLWHYSTVIPKLLQQKPSVNLNDINNNQDNAEGMNKQQNSDEKLKEFVDAIKSQNKQMSDIAMGIFCKQELEKRQSQFIVEHDLKILTTTWNVNGQKPPCEEIEDVFKCRNVALDTVLLEIKEIDDIPDVIVFNFQEIVPLNAKSMIISGLQPQLWEKYLTQELNGYYQRCLADKVEISNVNYIEKKASHLQMGLFQILFVRKAKEHLISEIQLAQVGTGILGVGGNKGAIACSIKIKESRIAIINAHLAASQSKVYRRNQNVQQILKSLVFTYQNQEKGNLFEHDVLLWCGDLNYRINSDNFQQVVDMIKQNKIYELRKLDQLKVEKSAGNVFTEFEEGKLKFPPTYKFKVGTNDYDAEKIRIPSWCDRILYRGDNVNQLFYSCVTSPLLSDHKPVVSLFNVRYKEIDPIKQKIVTQEIMEYLRNLKDNFIPKMKISSKEINFDSVRYGDTQFMKLEIENVGDGLLEFDIERVEDRPGQIQNWLQIWPLQGVLKAGEKMTVNFKVYVGHREAQQMFLYKDQEEYIRIKTNEPGQIEKQVVQIKCQYSRSCFGAALSILNQCVGIKYNSVREELQPLSFEEILLFMDSRRMNDFTLPVPKELYKMVNFILDNGKLKPDIFFTSGNAQLSKNIREKIDNNQALDPIEDDVYTVATVLVDFLQVLLTPVLPIHIMDDIVSLYEMYGDSDELVIQQLLFRLPKDNSMTFVFLLSFFKEMLNYSGKNKLTPEKICELLSECLIGEDKLNHSQKFRRDSMVRASPKKTGTKTAKELESMTQPGRNTQGAGSNHGSFAGGNNVFSRMLSKSFGAKKAQGSIGHSNKGPDEENFFGVDMEQEETVKPSAEQLKSKLRYQGLLLHLFE